MARDGSAYIQCIYMYLAHALHICTGNNHVLCVLIHVYKSASYMCLCLLC